MDTFDFDLFLYAKMPENQKVLSVFGRVDGYLSGRVDITLPWWILLRLDGYV